MSGVPPSSGRGSVVLWPVLTAAAAAAAAAEMVQPLSNLSWSQLSWCVCEGTPAWTRSGFGWHAIQYVYILNKVK